MIPQFKFCKKCGNSFDIGANLDICIECRGYNKNKVMLTAETDLEDSKAREMIDKIWSKIETINERTKIHTIDIRNLKKEVRRLGR